MKKKYAVILQLSVIAAAVIAAAFYLGIGFYYREGFSFGTYINGVYCTGKSVEEVNAELKALYGETEISVQDAFQREYIIQLKDVQFDVDYTSQLMAIQNAQNPFAWFENVTGAHSQTIHPYLSFDAGKLEEALQKCGIEQKNEKEHTVAIRPERGYVLYDGMKQVLDMAQVSRKVSEALAQGVLFVDVSDCYADLPYTEEMKQTLALWEKTERFMKCGIIYDMGEEKLALTPEITAKFITLNEDGSFALDETGNLICDETAIEAFIEQLCKTYDTLGGKRIFRSTRGEDIVIEGGTYGSKLNQKAELAYLKKAFLEKTEEIHIPTYQKEAPIRGKNDIGDTYIEIDMTLQKLYYYKDGRLQLETDVVTGNTGRKMGTPTGVNYVYAKQKNRTLRGPGYASFVKFWMPVNGGIGIHDASWRNKFGGEIYKTAGSHGCINVPGEVMKVLYESVEVGIPVVMFY